MNIDRFVTGFVALATIAVAGCNQDPLGLLVSDVVFSDADAGGSSCVPTSEEELCDGLDNNCDGQTDEDFNLQVDPEHCGRCGNSCLKAGARTACELGECKYLGCAPGFVDLNNKPEDGCEYECTATGGELCDGKDNDCNGESDELFDLDTDVDNCGACDNACQIANAIPKCVQGICEVQQCEVGFIDKDKDEDNGCEQPCDKTNSGVEICDQIDNDCNGVIDDPGGVLVDFDTDPLNCGACGVVCALPNAQTDCNAGKCEMAGCLTSYVDADGDPLTGCECLLEGVEVCDGKDNDCNNSADDNPTDVGGVCGTNDGECVAGVWQCVAGGRVCVGSVGPTAEHCADGKDTDCDSAVDPASCVYASGNREMQLDQTSGFGISNSAQLAIAGTDQRVLAVWLDRRSDHGEIWGALSTNGGADWGAEFAVTNPSDDTTQSKLDPQVAFGGGTPPRMYVAHERFASKQRDVYLRRSDDGSGWNSPVLVEKVGTATYDALFVRLAVWPGASDDVVVVCWERIYTSGAIRPNIRCARSTDSGDTFGDDVQVNATSNLAFVPEVAIDDQRVYVTWQEDDATSTNPDKIKVASAPLSGAFSFSETTLSSTAGREPQIAADGNGAVVVVWEDLPANGLIDLRSRRTADHGGTWPGSPTRVDVDVTNGDSLDPSIAIRPGSPATVFVAWADTSRGAADIYVNRSTNGGASWGTARRATAGAGSEAGKHTSSRPKIAVSPTNNNVYVVWEDLRNGLHHDIYAGVSLDNGIVWNRPDYRVDASSAAGAADARAPLLWVSDSGSGDRAAVIWLDNRTANSGAATGANADVWASYLQ